MLLKKNLTQINFLINNNYDVCFTNLFLVDEYGNYIKNSKLYYSEEPLIKKIFLVY